MGEPIALWLKEMPIEITPLLRLKVDVDQSRPVERRKIDDQMGWRENETSRDERERESDWRLERTAEASLHENGRQKGVFSDRKLKWIVRRMTQPIILFGSLNNGLVTWDGPDVLFGSPNIKIHRTHSQIPRQSKASRSCTNLKTRSRSAFPWANSVNNCPSKSPRSSILYPFVLPSPLSLLHPITYTEIEAFRFSTQNCLTLAPHTNRPSTLYTFTSSRLCNPKSDLEKGVWILHNFKRKRLE